MGFVLNSSSVCFVEISSVFFCVILPTNQPTNTQTWKQTSLMKYSLLKCKVKCPSDSKHYYYLEVRISCLKSLFFFPLHLFNKLETRSFCLRFVWSRRNPPTYLWERWSWMKFGSKHAGGSSHFCLRKSGSEVKKGGGGALGMWGIPDFVLSRQGGHPEGFHRWQYKEPHLPRRVGQKQNRLWMHTVRC